MVMLLNEVKKNVKHKELVNDVEFENIYTHKLHIYECGKKQPEIKTTTTTTTKVKC